MTRKYTAEFTGINYSGKKTEYTIKVTFELSNILYCLDKGMRLLLRDEDITTKDLDKIGLKRESGVLAEHVDDEFCQMVANSLAANFDHYEDYEGNGEDLEFNDSEADMCCDLFDRLMDRLSTK